jgi:two-component system, LytTR family, response regulator
MKHPLNKHSETPNPTRVPFANGKVVLFISVQELVYVKANGNYSELVFLDGKKQLISQTMKEIETLLSQRPFSRIHNSYLINLEHLVQYQRGEGGAVVMLDGARLPVSKGRKEELMKRLRLI